MVTKETKIDILSRYCADQIGHGMREKVYDVIKHVVDFLESDRASEVGVGCVVMPKIAEMKLPTDTELDWIDEVKTMSCTPKHYFIRGAIYMREKVLQQLNK